MYKRVLVPLDGSVRAETILPHVEHLARNYGAELILLYVEENVLLLERDEVVEMAHHQQEFDRRRRKMEAYLAERQSELERKAIPVRSVLVHGTPVRTILKIAGEYQADLIAMASHGVGDPLYASYGSVAAGVLQQADRPLLLIRAQGA
jgi:nucleotide-binding universal stress UspA family protein